jgi:lipopolysaccharide export system protein LptA
VHYLRDAARVFALAASFALAAIITPDIVQAASATAPTDVSSSDTAPAASTPATPISTISKRAPTSTNEGAGPSAASPPSEPASAAKAAPSAGNDSDSNGNPAGASGQGSSPFAAFDATPSHGPIDINSDSLFLDYKKNQVFYRGHVHAKQADAQLLTDSLEVVTGKDFHEVQQLLAEGNVRISRGTQWATGDHLVVDELKHTAILTGSPVVHDGNDQISGRKITVYLQTGQSVVEGARAVIFPRPSKTKDNSASADHVK